MFTVTDDSFNRKHYPDLIGQKYEVAPSYAHVTQGEVLYVVCSYYESVMEEEPMFWNNAIGWCSLPDATVFTEQEKNTYYLPLGGTWVALPQSITHREKGTKQNDNL